MGKNGHTQHYYKPGTFFGSDESINSDKKNYLSSILFSMNSLRVLEKIADHIFGIVTVKL